MVSNSPHSRFSRIPQATGLYDPAFEKDACGFAVVATLRGTPGHDIVNLALEALRNMEHRGAVGSDAGTGDGAGILTQIPDEFFRASVDFELPAPEGYVAGAAFLPIDPVERAFVVGKIGDYAAAEGLTVLGWRTVPTDATVLGSVAREVMPEIEQVFFAGAGESGIALDRLAFRLRKRAERELNVFFPSLSCRTLVYKGMVTTLQLEAFYPDLSDLRFTSRLALVHSRFSTNTFPAWALAQPFRFLAHNGEINTVQGNRNWMRARQSQLHSDVLGDIQELLPIVTPGGSDSASFDEVLELLTLAGRSLPHAIMMMIPESFENQPDMPEALRAFYDFHSGLMEPWDGPAAMVFSDGTLVGASLDRNGLRPGRFLVTDDGLVVLASEIGVLEVDPASVVRKGRLRPGKMFLVDTDAGRIIEDEEIKQSVASLQPWGEWLTQGRINLRDLPEREHIMHTPASVGRRQRTFGYTEEELRVLIAPMAQHGVEPIGAMGTDTPIAVLAERPRLLFDYFTQQFAQVTNPPLDSIREAIVTSMTLGLGPELNLLEATSEHAYQIILNFPVIDNDELAKIQHIDASPGSRTTTTIRGLYRVDDGERAMADRLSAMCNEVDDAIERGAKYIVLSDRESTKDLAPIPSLLMLSTIHHHLVRQENRLRVGLIVEAGDVREVHHVAMLVGYGASAINPYLAMETAEQLVHSGVLTGLSAEQAVANIIRALGKGVLKTMSKMGISVVSSYAGAQAFEALGLAQDFVDRYFTGTVSRLGGVGIDIIAAENLARHRRAYPDEAASNVHERLSTGGEYQWRRGGPPHLFNPETVFRLQHSTRSGRYDVFRDYTRLVDDQAEQLMTLRGLFALREGERPSVPLSEVEPVSSIVRRFSTGAMSYGSISEEAHETLALAMNHLGAKSNTGEGGETVERLLDPKRCSAIKQVASARFGVTSLYLTNATDIQIKMAQGAKPGEGGQLPPEKVYPWIARTRHATAGVGLISPPPHHDIYSIEDLKQLIFDLKRANPVARIHVKLVSESGIGAVASGVAKALADVILVSGHDGGTGASPLSSLKHTGTPWELGLAETQQTLMMNGLRDRVVLQVDGQLKTGRDVMVAALLGAEEFGFATAPLVVSGCVMMRVCHLDTCPVGVATQNPELRARFEGKPEFVVNFFEFLAEEVREYLAALGFRSLEEAIGHRELLNADSAVSHWKAGGLDLAPILSGGAIDPDAPLSNRRGQDHDLERHGDRELIERCEAALERSESVEVSVAVKNTDRAIGTLLGHELTKRFGEAGLPDDTIAITLTGTAGQSLGAFLPPGISLHLEGDANDYVGKGLSGGIISLRPSRGSNFRAEHNVIAGNVIGYGATSGSLFIRGIVGERFLVRNSGVTAVVEGVGDHALEYMTGGVAVILGPAGRNLGAGMSGGTAYIHQLLPDRVNQEALNQGELILETLDRADVELLRGLLERHVTLTGSTVAASMLESFATTVTGFVKVVPRDFSAVLETRAAAIAEGLDPDGPIAWARIMEVTGG
jgi:glutamate synthase (NADPH/NADH) large chain